MRSLGAAAGGAGDTSDRWAGIRLFMPVMGRNNSRDWPVLVLLSATKQKQRTKKRLC